jgi:hypothetical protein
MGLDEKRVRAKFIQLLRARSPDHPFVRQHDRWVREHVEAQDESIEDLIVRVCCDRCSLGLSCATQSFCYLEGRALGEGGGDDAAHD